MKVTSSVRQDRDQHECSGTCSPHNLGAGGQGRYFQQMPLVPTGGHRFRLDPGGSKAMARSGPKDASKTVGPLPVNPKPRHTTVASHCGQGASEGQGLSPAHAQGPAGEGAPVRRKREASGLTQRRDSRSVSCKARALLDALPCSVQTRGDTGPGAGPTTSESAVLCS